MSNATAPERQRSGTKGETACLEYRDLPKLPFERTRRLYRNVALYSVFLVLTNVAIPCAIYYAIVSTTNLGKREAVGISSASLGLSSCFDAPFRVYRLVRYRKRYGPLGDDVWWHFDWTMFVWTVALLVFAFPLAIGPIVPLYSFFLMSMPLLVAPIGLIFLFTLKSWRLPFWFSSDPPRTPTKPGAFYFLEDMLATDFDYGRDWRKAVRERFDASIPFQHLMYAITLWLPIWTAAWFGASAAIAWAAPFRVAFGLVLGLFFVWLIVGLLITAAFAKGALARERTWFAKRAGEKARQP